MKSSEICQLAINICTWMYGRVAYRDDSSWLPTDQSLWAKYNGLTWWNDAWHADCLGFVRAVLCGWSADKTIDCGGANTGYPCYMYNEQMFIDSCLPAQGGGGVSSDFTQIASHPCSLLYKDGHVGLYIGELQIGGKFYNTAEVTTSYIDDQGRPGGGRLAWVDSDGRRRPSKNEPLLNSWWEQWGVFGTSGVKYGITEYDGGATGATGFGSALTQPEVDFYWDSLTDLTFDYVQGIADTIHGMSADVFTVMAGWGWGEGYSFIPPLGDSEPDKYMAYLCDCCPVNYFEGWGIDTGYQMAAAIAGGDHSGHYSYENMIARGLDLKANETSSAGQNELRALLLALLNPEQRAWFCSGYPQPGDDIVYQREYAGQGMIYSFNDPGSKVDYDITGTGIRGGWNPVPVRTIGKTLISIKPIQMRNWYRNKILLRR